MKITKIEKKKRLYLVELDETEKLYVTEDTIVRFMMTKGMTISEEELRAIKDFAQFSYGKNLALYHLSFKKRTEKEVRDYLNQHEIDEKIIPKVLKSLKEDKWIDDENYVRQIVASNLHTGDKGAYHLKQKLIQKGISSSLIDPILADSDFSPLAEKIAEKLLRKYQNKLPQKALLDKILQFLLNKGFSFSEAKAALESLEVEKDEEQEEELIYKELEKQHRRLSKKYQDYELKQRLTQTLARKGYDYDKIRSVLGDFL